MSSRAQLPNERLRRRLDDLVDIAAELAEGLESLEKSREWRIWNEGGAPFGRPQFKGPGGWTAPQFSNMADQLHRRLDQVAESFEHRLAKEEERRAKRAEKHDHQSDGASSS